MNPTMSSRSVPRRNVALNGGLLLAVFIFALRASSAFALPTYPAAVTALYHPVTDSVMDKAIQSCNLCHEGGPPKLNVYGADVKAALHAAHTKELSAAILKAVEDKDSDGDGASNGAEMAAGTLPGDPSSKPATTGTAKPPVAAPAPASKPADEEPGPWSLRGMLFPRHAQHPVIVHFPIALLMISLVFDFLGMVKRNSAASMAGYYNLSVAAASAPLAVITGLMAWQFKYGGTALQGNLLYHLIMGVTTTLLTWLLWAVRARQIKAGQTNINVTYGVLAALAALAITLTGHLGGILSSGG